MTIRYFSHLLTAVVLGILVGSCSASRDLPEEQVMLNRVKVLADGKYQDINPSQLKSYVQQKGNARWFSALKIPLGVYAMAGSDTTKAVNRTLRAMGEAPVIYDTLKAENSCLSLQKALQNKGYLDAQVELFTDRKGKKVDAIYILHPGKPYYIRKFNYDIQDSCIHQLLMKQYRLREGMVLNVEMLNEERNRLTRYLQNQGYYRFHKEFISFQVDTLKSARQADVTLLLRPFRTNDITDTLHTVFKVRRISYASGDPQDSVIHPRHHVLRENTFIEEGQPYSASALQNT